MRSNKVTSSSSGSPLLPSKFNVETTLDDMVCNIDFHISSSISDFVGIAIIDINGDTHVNMQTTHKEARELAKFILNNTLETE